jgi:carboxylate-amine ligase
MTDLTTGVEEEFQLIDVETGHLVSRAVEVLATAAHPGLEHEMHLSQVEVATPVCTSLGRLRQELAELRAVVDDAARVHGCRMVSAGTHPDVLWDKQDLTPSPRYDFIRQHYAQLGREQVVFGQHVHIGIPNQELRIQVMNRVRPWLSVLLAVTASSPYWEGRDTDYASYRSVVFGRWPTFQTPDVFSSWAESDTLVEDLTHSGSIDDARSLYWTVRPSSRFPTLEFRVSDACTTLDEAVLATGLTRALARTALMEAEAYLPVPPVRAELIRAAEWQAARWGLEGNLVDPRSGQDFAAKSVVDIFVDHISPGLDANGERDEVMELLDQVLVHGNSATRQRRAFAKRGSLTDVVAMLGDETSGRGALGHCLVDR